MIQGDIGNNRQQRLHDVGGIQPASHAGFQDDGIGLFLGKVEQGHGSDKLKKGGQLICIHHPLHLIDQGKDLGIVNIPVFKPKSFRES